MTVKEKCKNTINYFFSTEEKYAMVRLGSAKNSTVYATLKALVKDKYQEQLSVKKADGDIYIIKT